MLKTVNHLENIVEDICISSYPYEWDENHLSFQLMKEMRRLFAHRIIHFNQWSKIVNWQSFKNRGLQETKYGDIALLVNVQFTTGETLKGVAFLEAKRDYNSGNFESIDIDQFDFYWEILDEISVILERRYQILDADLKINSLNEVIRVVNRSKRQSHNDRP